MLVTGTQLAVTLLGIVVGLASLAQAETATPAPLPKIRIVLAGDSTVTDEVGWGKGFAARLRPEAECINESIGGRSSKSFRDEGRWTKALAHKPDYILIQFGHNDRAGKGAHRETDPNTTYRENMARYVDEARAIGAKPILVTSICIRNFDKEGKFHEVPWLTEYVEVVRQVAAEKDVPLLDMQARTFEMYTKLGDKGSEEISLVNGHIDMSHLGPKGGQVVGAIVSVEMGKVVPDIAPYLLEDQSTGRTSPPAG